MNSLIGILIKNRLAVLFVCCLSFTPGFMNAQKQIELPSPVIQNNVTEHKTCATLPKTEAQRRYTLDVIDQHGASRNTGTTCLPIRAHIVTLDDGSGGISLGDINIGLSYLNSFYLEAGIEFYLCSENIINSTDWYTFDASEEAAMTAAHTVDDAINIYFVDDITINGGGACGYAYFPSNSDVTINILMDNGCTVGNANGTLVHELGHFFDLAHTHSGTEFGNMHSNAEHVPRSGPNSNCDTDGDLLCDTEADPNGSNDGNCNFINDGEDSEDVFMNVYAPELNNIMSYYSDNCGGIFTPGQYGRIINGLAERQGHTAYDLDGCAPNVVIDPSGLTAAINSSYGVDLSWTDNATNELGYLIERSSDGGTTWAAIIGGGVGPDVTTYTDNTVEANTTYEYRVKASNDDCNDYSASASIAVGLIYCIPTHQFNSCDPNGTGLGVAIYDFKLQESGTNLINNPNNSCNGPLSIFSATHSASVVAGESYDVVVNFQLNGSGSYFPQFVTVWVDNNQNGSFDDSGEMLFQANSTGGPTVTAPILIPASILEGTTTLRVRTASNGSGIVDDPCNYKAFSEAEDYELIVTNPLPIALTDFNARLNKDQILLDWATETEENNDYFLIEKSIDGRNFQKIGTVQGSGSTFSNQTYNLIDNKPAIGTNYYRLTQFDFDGTFEIIDRIVSVDYDAKQEVSVQPNPVRGNQVQLVYQTLEAGPIEVQVFDITGKLLIDLVFEANAARNIFDIKLDDLNNGVYVIKTNQLGESKSLRFVKTNF